MDDLKAGKKSVHLTVRCTPEQLDEIREYASSRGIPYAKFVLDAVYAAMKPSDEESPAYYRLEKRLEALEELIIKQAA